MHVIGQKACFRNHRTVQCPVDSEGLTHMRLVRKPVSGAIELCSVLLILKG